MDHVRFAESGHGHWGIWSPFFSDARDTPGRKFVLDDQEVTMSLVRKTNMVTGT
jgi:hypothetical protein